MVCIGCDQLASNGLTRRMDAHLIQNAAHTLMIIGADAIHQVSFISLSTVAHSPPLMCLQALRLG
jgi:hypothetical protein